MVTYSIILGRLNIALLPLKFDLLDSDGGPSPSIYSKSLVIETGFPSQHVYPGRAAKRETPGLTKGL